MTTGRTRIKQKFRPNEAPIEYWFPPKWEINEAVVRRPARANTTTTLFAMEREKTMDLHTFQERAKKTDRNPGTNEQSRMIPLAGLASETGELLGEYKKYLRDGESTSCLRNGSLRRWVICCGMLPTSQRSSTLISHKWRRKTSLNVKDDGESSWLGNRSTLDFPMNERFPRQFSIDFLTYHDGDDSPKVRVMYKGKQFGDDLNDNAHI